MSLRDDAQKEIQRLGQGAGDGVSHVSVTADKDGVSAEAEVELGRNWSAVGWVKQTWTQGRAWAAGVAKSWGGKR